MALDVPALPIVSQTLKYVKAAWDVDYAGGAAGLIGIVSQQVPSGALILGHLFLPVDAFVDIGTSTVTVGVGVETIGDPSDPATGGSWIEFAQQAPYPNDQGSVGVTVTVAGDGYSAGSAYIYVFYV